MKKVNLKTKLDTKTFEAIQICQKVSDLCGIKIYLVGGIVRDILLSKQIQDVDITVEGNVSDLVNALVKNTKIKKFKINENLPTAKVVFQNGIEIDFASTRKEIYEKNGDLPKITEIGCSLEEDVKRRDFTINTLIISLNQNDLYCLYDYENGLKDLQQKKIRVLHPHSFFDDPSRIIRAIKFSTRLDFQITQETENLISEYLKKPLKNIPLKRIKKEFIDIFSTNQISYLKEIQKRELYKIIGINKYKQIDVIKIKWATIDFKIQKEDLWLLYFVSLYSDSEISEKLNLTTRELGIINNFQKILKEKPTFKDKYSLYKYFENKDYLTVILYGIYFDLKTAKEYFKIQDIKLEITGNELQNANIPKGKIYSDIQQAILKEKLNNNLKGKEKEINFAKNFYEQNK